MDYSLLMCVQENPAHLLMLKNLNLSMENMSDATSMSMNTRASRSEAAMELRKSFEGSRHKFLSTCGRYIYHIGIIDYL